MDGVRHWQRKGDGKKSRAVRNQMRNRAEQNRKATLEPQVRFADDDQEGAEAYAAELAIEKAADVREVAVARGAALPWGACSGCSGPGACF